MDVSDDQDRWTYVVWGSWPRQLRVGVQWRVLEGEWECVGLRIETAAGTCSRPLLAGDLRSIRMGRLLDLARHAIEIDQGTGQGLPRGIAPGQSDESQEQPAPKRKGGRPLLEAKRIYAEALGRGEPPNKAIAKHFGVKPNTAAKWIVECRKKGLLGRTKQGRAGGVAFDRPYARSVLANAGYSREEIARILYHFPRFLEPELVEALRAADKSHPREEDA